MLCSSALQPAGQPRRAESVAHPALALSHLRWRSSSGDREENAARHKGANILSGRNCCRTLPCRRRGCSLTFSRLRRAFYGVLNLIYPYQSNRSKRLQALPRFLTWCAKINMSPVGPVVLPTRCPQMKSLLPATTLVARDNPGSYVPNQSRLTSHCSLPVFRINRLARLSLYDVRDSTTRTARKQIF